MVLLVERNDLTKRPNQVATNGVSSRINMVVISLTIKYWNLVSLLTLYFILSVPTSVLPKYGGKLVVQSILQGTPGNQKPGVVRFITGLEIKSV